MVSEEIESRNTIRLSVPIEKEINDRLASLLPAGSKAQVIRSLVELFIQTQESSPEEYLAQALIKGHCQLSIQNLKGKLQ